MLYPTAILPSKSRLQQPDSYACEEFPTMWPLPVNKTQETASHKSQQKLLLLAT
jgi:hypothetical protein